MSSEIVDVQPGSPATVVLADDSPEKLATELDDLIQGSFIAHMPNEECIPARITNNGEVDIDSKRKTLGDWAMIVISDGDQELFRIQNGRIVS
jgi:hypothetical protein